MDSVNRVQVRPHDNERREFKRFAMRCQVQARRDDLLEPSSAGAGDAPESNVALEVRNFSLGGMRGGSPLALRRDERLTLSMPPFGTRPQIEVTGRVVRCHREQDGFDVGIEFCQTGDEPESSPWLRLPDLFYMAGETDRKLH
jgi:hypothetical protein